jgi:hypothetical protein
MPYFKKPVAARHHRRRRRALMGFGDYNDETLCSAIPAGDPYRKPGNYCSTGDGGYTTFNSDGSAYAMPAGTETPGILSKIGSALSTVLGQQTPAPMPAVAAPGMSTTTMIALAGGAVLLVVLLTRDR